MEAWLRSPKSPRRIMGTCDDCGRGFLVRGVTFAMTGMRYQVCSTHEREYRRNRLLRAGAWEATY